MTGRTYFPAGDRCLMVELGSEVDAGLNRRVLSLIQGLTAARLAFVDDIVPCWTGFGVYYRPEALPATASAAPYEHVREQVDAVLARSSEDLEIASRDIEIPVCYGGEFGPDLGEVAEHCGLTQDQVIGLHASSAGRVFMVGFAPGHPFIGFLDERLAVPRRSTPRTRVPAGTVAIANCQTNIYPFELPGGWNLIGRTPLKAFDVARAQPSLVRPGDKVRFVAISREEFDHLQQAEAR